MKKKTYITPLVSVIELDNVISLALESTPPQGPNEGASLAPDYKNENPFKMDLA